MAKLEPSSVTAIGVAAVGPVLVADGLPVPLSPRPHQLGDLCSPTPAGLRSAKPIGRTMIHLAHFIGHRDRAIEVKRPPDSPATSHRSSERLLALETEC